MRASTKRAQNFAARATSTSKIVYTGTDEAPALATYSLLPIIEHFAGKIGVEVEKKDISLAARIISQFPKYLTDEQRIPDNLALLGEMCTQPDANVIKLPNISASLPQLEAAITELRTKGYDIPMYVAEPKTEKERVIHSRYAKVIGSAVNPVLREGNSDRRVAAPVKNYAKKNPHQMGAWSKASRSHVAFMEKGDFYASEKSCIASESTSLKIELVKKDGSKFLLKESVPVDSGDVVDTSFMSVKELRAFFEKEIQEAFNDHMLISLHMKATMMKVSDPVIFGHCVEVFYKDVFEKHADTLAELNVNVSKGFQDLLDKIKLLPEVKKTEIENDIEECYQQR
jgi:isocitrate dehydrogenase